VLRPAPKAGANVAAMGRLRWACIEVAGGRVVSLTCIMEPVQPLATSDGVWQFGCCFEAAVVCPLPGPSPSHTSKWFHIH
jgi:hypothetical protein